MANEDSFAITGPSFLTALDWNNSNHRRSVAASLVQGVYILERDRKLNRQGPQALAPPWWEAFHFTLNRVLVDDHDLSYFGAIYEFKYPSPQYIHIGQPPPHYVIAFRGSLKHFDFKTEDFKNNLYCMINNLEDTQRLKIGIDVAGELVSRLGAGNLWITGHSIGSSISLAVGRYMAKNMGVQIETYLFNPPFTSPPLELIKNEKVKLGLRMANSVVTAGLLMATNGGKTTKSQQGDPFAVLAYWVPYLFVNSSDMICSEYIGYFEHREKMESMGSKVGKIGKLATRHSIGSVVKSALGKDSEATHLIPSAYLSINSKDSKESHGIQQWWKPDLELKYRLYQYKPSA